MIMVYERNAFWAAGGFFTTMLWKTTKKRIACKVEWQILIQLLKYNRDGVLAY